MKKKLTIVTVLLALICALCAFSACGKADIDPVVLKPSDSDMEIAETTTLLDYMDYLVGKGELKYEISGTMITSINGVKNGTKSFWMLYCDDTANSNGDWGTCEYGGKTYYSATAGASELIVADGCTYIWSYETF